MKIYRQHYFTLLETLIAMSLTVVVLTTLTFFYRQITELNGKAELMQKEGFKMRYIENRLSKIFPQAIPSGKKSPDFFFFTVSDPGSVFAQSSPISLIFGFDNGVNLSKDFSNQVIGRIYLDGKGRLSLATWPAQSRWVIGATIPMKMEVLLEDVDLIKFWFFVAPDKKWQLDSNQPTTPPANPTAPPKLEVIVNPSPEGEWIQEWSQDYNQLPALIKLEVVRKGKTDYFVFPLSKSKRQPVYTQ